MSLSIATLLLAASLVTAAPAPVPTSAPLELRAQPFAQAAIAPWDTGAVDQYPIHSSCNATQRRQIAGGLNETIELATHARAHALRWGNESEIYRKYFGNRPSFEVIGAFDAVANGDKSGVLFRCDDPDGNCRLDGWGGHWRGSNATGETVICNLSYRTRRSLSTMCALGYEVGVSPINTFWASDLMHRLFHMPAVGQHHVEHYADGYEEVVDLAQSDEDDSTHDSEALQFFALEAYSFDIAVPGVGCPGPRYFPGATSSSVTALNATSVYTATAAPVATTSGTPTVSQSASTTFSIPANCHTHEGGVLHCT